MIREIVFFHLQPLCSIFEPVFRFLGPHAGWIFPMQQIKRGLGPTAGIFISTTKSRRVHGKMESFGYSCVGRICVCPLNDLARDVVWSCAKTIYHSNLTTSGSSFGRC